MPARACAGNRHSQPPMSMCKALPNRFFPRSRLGKNNSIYHYHIDTSVEVPQELGQRSLPKRALRTYDGAAVPLACGCLQIRSDRSHLMLVKLVCNALNGSFTTRRADLHSQKLKRRWCDQADSLQAACLSLEPRGEQPRVSPSCALQCMVSFLTHMGGH